MKMNISQSLPYVLIFSFISVFLLFILHLLMLMGAITYAVLMKMVVIKTTLNIAYVLKKICMHLATLLYGFRCMVLYT